MTDKVRRSTGAHVVRGQKGRLGQGREPKLGRGANEKSLILGPGEGIFAISTSLGH